MKFLRKAMKRYGRPETIVTDKLGSYRAALRMIGKAACQETGRWLKIGRKTLTSPSDDANGQCSGFGRWEVFRNSQQFIHPYRIISIRSAISTAAKISS